MTVHYATKGFVFKKENRQEADRVFSVFAQDLGRIEIFAKAIRRIDAKLKGGIEIFSFSQLSFIQGQRQKTLTDAVFLEKFNTLPQSPEKMEVASRVALALDDFIKGQEADPKIWNVILDFFQKLDGLAATNVNCQLYFQYFFWNFMKVLGYGVQVDCCAVCQKLLQPESVYFSNKDGGTICKICAPSHDGSQKIHADVVKIIRLILKNEWDLLPKLKVKPDSLQMLREVSEKYGRYVNHKN